MDTQVQRVNYSLSIDEWLELYTEAMIGLYKRMFRYGNIPYNTKQKSYHYYQSIAENIFGKDYATDIDALLKENLEKQAILAQIESDYKRLCITYKSRYKEVLSDFFNHSLDADATVCNTLIDDEDQKMLAEMMKTNGETVAGFIAKRAAQGDVSAQLLMGKVYFLGWGVPVGFEEGIYWLKKAADSGDAEALYYTGKALDFTTWRETGVPLNTESLSFYYAAFDAGYDTSAYALYKHYSHYLTGKTGSFKSKKWLDIGIKNKNPYCLYEIEAGYLGDFMPENQKNIRDWLTAAMKAGIDGAGILYLKHFGDDEN